MKNIIYLFISLFFFQSLHAQLSDVSGKVLINGGSEFNPLRITSETLENWNSIDNSNGQIGYWGIFSNHFDMDFGTEIGNTNGRVHLVTETIPRLTVDADGDVGIGTTSPNAKLDVAGDISIGVNDVYQFNNQDFLRIEDQSIYMGIQAGQNTTQGVNTFIGHGAGRDNTTGNSNTFIGVSAGLKNDEGSSNVIIGNSVGIENTSGIQNTFLGTSSGNANTIGVNNIIIGAGTGNTNVDGDDNILIGNFADVAGSDFVNSMAIGTATIVDASNKVRIGNGFVTVIEGQVAFSASSDRRLKKNIQPTEIGLEFVNMLHPVTYNWKEGHGDKLYTGLIAQEVEEAANALGFDYSGIVIPESDEGFYSLRYAEFVIPLINAVQDLSKDNESLQNELASIKAELASLTSIVSSISKLQLEATEE